MTDRTLITQIQEGMEVHTADDVKLGKITQVWIGTDPASTSEQCDEELCSRLQVQHGDDILFIPLNVLARVSARWVILTIPVAAVHEHDWSRPPLWIRSQAGATRLVPAERLHL
jgi:hypothetical protein